MLGGQSFFGRLGKLRRRVRVAPLLVSAIVLCGLSVACSSKNTGDSKESDEGGAGNGGSLCSPGATRECVGPGACRGGQQCSSDGSMWSPCACGVGGTGTGGVGAGGGTGGT